MARDSHDGGAAVAREYRGGPEARVPATALRGRSSFPHTWLTPTLSMVGQRRHFPHLRVMDLNSEGPDGEDVEVSPEIIPPLPLLPKPGLIFFSLVDNSVTTPLMPAMDVLCASPSLLQLMPQSLKLTSPSHN